MDKNLDKAGIFVSRLFCCNVRSHFFVLSLYILAITSFKILCFLTVTLASKIINVCFYVCMVLLTRHGNSSVKQEDDAWTEHNVAVIPLLPQPLLSVCLTNHIFPCDVLAVDNFL